MEFKIFISEYLLILITMATIMFIANEVVKLGDAIHVMWVTRKVRRLCRERSYRSTSGYPTAEPEEAVGSPVRKAKPRQDTREWGAPRFQWKWIWYGLGVLGVILLLILVIGLLNYDPSGGR